MSDLSEADRAYDPHLYIALAIENGALDEADAGIEALPEDERSEPRRMLIGEILASRNEDGSFIGNTIIGPAFGTGAALLALQAMTR